MLAAPTSPIDASKFVAYVSERRKKRILFKGEFLIIQRSIDLQKCTTEIGMLFPSESHVLLLKMLNLFVEIPHFCNCMLRILYISFLGIRMGNKNQYPDTLPFDHNRVVLQLRPEIEDSHYINASYIPSWFREKAYIVTQSVKSKQASNDLW